MSLNRVEAAILKQESRIPLEEALFAIEQAALNNPLEELQAVLSLFEEHLEGDLTWNFPFQLLINNQINDRAKRLDLLFHHGLKPNTSATVTGLSLLGIAVLEENQDAVRNILSHMHSRGPALPYEEQDELEFDEFFDRRDGQDLSADHIIEGLKVYNPQNPRQILKQYEPHIDASRLSDVFEKSAYANGEFDQSILSAYQLAMVCNSPKEITDILISRGYAHGNVWAGDRNPPMMIPADQYV